MKTKNLILTMLIACGLFATNAYVATPKNNESQPTGQEEQTQVPENAPKVYFSKEITPESLIQIYKALGREAHGKVAVKLSMGEPGGNNYLKPELIGDFVKSVNGTFVDANTAYGGNRGNVADHMKAARDHGFTAIADVDILDADGAIRLPIAGGKHLTEDIVGSHFTNYDFYVNLSHFKGHASGGFGGAIKNMAIGLASPEGKNMIHTAGQRNTFPWGTVEQDNFLESMAEAAKAIADHCGENIIYISVMNNLSVDCDCDASPADPEMNDIGILASLDPVALDKACVDKVYTSDDHGKIHLIERMESRHGIHTLDYAEQIGVGSQTYQLVDLDK